MNKDALTAQEVAEMLNIAKNTVYELVKRNELKCYKVGRKMRFTYDDVQNYIHRDRDVSTINTEVQGNLILNGENPILSSFNNENNTSESAFRIFGQDEILESLAKYLNKALPALNAGLVHKGSYESLSALYKEEAVAAASHLWDRNTDTYNFEHIKYIVPACPVVLVHVCNRTEGLYVAEGNPKNITSWEDFGREDIVLANREPGAGTRILLDEHLLSLHIDAGKIKGYSNPFNSRFAVAGQVSKGTADVGVGTKRVALGIKGIDFIPLQEESYDLAIKKKNFESEPIQKMLSILKSYDFQEEFRYAEGYDLEGMGKILGIVNEG